MNPSRELAKREPEPAAIEKPIEGVAAPHSYNYGVDPNAETEVHLLDYWRAVRKRLWLVISIVVLVTMLSVLYVARKPDIYQAEARVQVDLENNAALVGRTPYVIGPANDPTYFNTQLQILTSPGLLRRVVKTLDLEHNPDFFKGSSTQKRSTWQTVMRMVGLGSEPPEDPKSRPRDELPLRTTVAPASSREDLVEAKQLSRYVGAILGNLRVNPVKETRGYYKETRLIDVSFTHTDPQVAAKVVNAIAETYVFSNLEKKTETNTSTGDFLQKRVAELQQQIREDEERLVNYARNNQIISLDASQNTVVARLAGLSSQLLEAENDRKRAEADYHGAKYEGAASALVDADEKRIGDLESRLADLRQKRAQLLVEATEEAPEVKEVTQQIRELESQVKDLRSRKSTTLLTNLETRYRQTSAREEALRKAFDKQRSETLTQNEAAINYRIIQQEIETNKSLLANLLQRSKENDVVMAGKPNNISIIDYAIAPDGPIGPNRMRTVFIALFLSTGLGVGFALFLEYLDDTVHSTDEVERLLHLPALAVIPSVGAGTRRRLLGGPGALQKHNGHLATNPELLMNVDGRSPLAESYRHLRTSVLLSTAGRAPRSLLVTSSLPGEGKTTTAVNTAISLAQTGASVVIIDADMRRPRLHSIFNLSDRAGLSSILSSDLSEAGILELVWKDEVTGLHLLTSGPIPPNPAELLGSDQMRRLIAALQSNFSHVVVDSPPVSSFTDGVLISSMVDGVLLVVHGGKSSRHIVKRSRQLLQDVGAKIFGVVLNNVSLQSHDYYYYQRYYSRRYYDKDVDQQAVAGR
ncbi:MAG: polysaccharide biosynthesis tyrosine autokinase [Pyrinomonadaceae bacterium]|jgi:capsular exopolysaccharide synthesis family protein|nr:polysaccharide biosynthesis tyrosine autokinase [Pyrinomonadaceae bacterium]